MATYIQGLTGNAPQIQQFKPDHNFYQSVLTLKQNQYDQGLQQVSSLYGSALDVELTRSDNKQKKQEFFDQIEGGIKKLAGLDLSLKQNVEQAYGLFNQFLHDESIQHDAWFTRTSNDELAKAKAYKNCMNPEECGGMWWEGGERLIRLSMKAYEDATAEEAMSMLPQEYVPAQNIHKIATDYIKELGIDKTVEYIDDSKTFVVKDKNGEIVNDEIAEVLNGVLWSDPRIQQFYTAQQKLDRLEFVMLNKDRFGSMDVANAAYYGMKQKQIIDGLKLQNQFYEYDIERGNYKDDDEKNIILSTIERNKAKIENIKQKNDVLLSIANAVLKYNEDNSNPLDIDDGTTNTSNDSIKKQIEEYMQIDKGITASLDRINALYEQSISEGIFNPDFSPEQLDFNMANFMFSLFVTDYSPVLSNLWSTHSHKKWGTPLRGGRSGSNDRWVEKIKNNGRDITVYHNGSYTGDSQSGSGNSSSGGKKTKTTLKFGGKLPIYQDEGEVDVSKSLDAAKNKTPYPDSLFTPQNVLGPYTNLNLTKPSQDKYFINYGLSPFDSYEPQYISYPTERALTDWLEYAHGIEADKTGKFKDIDTEASDKPDATKLKLNRFLFEHKCTFGQFMNAAKKGIFSTPIFENTASDRVYSDLNLNVRVLSGNNAYKKVNLFRQNADEDIKNPHAGSKFRNYDISKGNIDAGNVLLQDTEEGYEMNVKSQLDNVVSNFMQLEKVLNVLGQSKALKPIIEYSGWGKFINIVNDTTITPQGDTIIKQNIDSLSNYSSSTNQFNFNIDEGLTSSSRDTTAYKQYYPEIKSGSEFLNSIITLLAQTGNYEMSNFVMQGAFSMSSQLDDQIQMHYNFMNETLNSMLEIVGQNNMPNLYEYFDIPQDMFVNVVYVGSGSMGGSGYVQELESPFQARPQNVSKDKIYYLQQEDLNRYAAVNNQFTILRNFLCFNNLCTFDQSTNPGGLLFSSVKNWDSFISSDDANAIKEYMSDEIDGNGHFAIKEGDANVKRLDGKDYFSLSPIELELMNNSRYQSTESDVNNYQDALDDAQEKSKNYFKEKGISYEFDKDGILKVTKTTDKYSASVNITPEVAQNIIHGYNINTFSVVAENYGLRTDFDFHDNLVLPNGEVQPPNPNAITIGDKKKIIDDLGKDLPELFNHRTEAFKYEKTSLLGTISDMWSMMMGFDDRPDFEPYKIWGSSGEGKSNRYQYENQEDVSVLAKTITDAWHGLYSWSLNKNKSRYVNLGDIYNDKEGYGKTYKVTVDYNNVNGTNEYSKEEKTLADDVACNYFVSFLNAVSTNNNSTLPTMVIKCYNYEEDGKNVINRWPLTTEDHQELINADKDKITYDISGELNKFSDYTSKKKFNVYVSPIANDDQRYMGIHITGFDKDTNKGIDYDGLTVYVPVQNVMFEKFTHQYRNNLFEICLPGCKEYKIFSDCLKGNFVFEKRNDKKWYLTTIPPINDVDISSMYDKLNVGDMRYRGYNLQVGKLPDKVEPSYIFNAQNENINKDLFYEWRTYGINDYDFPNMMRLFNERLIYLDGLMRKSAIQRLVESYKKD